MKKLATTCLLLVIALVSISAYLRLDHSGIGCMPWPACYGNIAVVNEQEASVDKVYERLVEDATQPMSWATPAHRLIATVLGLLVVALTLWSFLRRRDRALSVAVLFLTVFLAWLGIYSGGLTSPAVVMGNLGGGFLMLALLGWMVFRDHQPSMQSRPRARNWIVAALLVLVVQIGLGGLTSANFAASACQTVPDCHGSWLPGPDLWTAFDLSRSHQLSPDGQVVGGAERADIQKLHRLFALVTTLLASVAGVLAIRDGLGATGIVVLAVVVSEFLIGVAAIITDLPITIAVAHNWLAAILLLALLRLLALSDNSYKQQALT
jgi:cytochrome c oxidase assembly protein subunit 15